MNPKNTATMKVTLVTRHPGALAWLRLQWPQAEFEVLTHVEGEFTCSAGDVVAGVLPVWLVAQVCSSGGEAWVLELDLSVKARGQEWSLEDMRAMKARLVRYDARVIARR
jgi:CRISPR-associated protein Csx16